MYKILIGDVPFAPILGDGVLRSDYRRHVDAEIVGRRKHLSTIDAVPSHRETLHWHPPVVPAVFNTKPVAPQPVLGNRDVQLAAWVAGRRPGGGLAHGVASARWAVFAVASLGHGFLLY